jgi:hypothetical protein
VPSAPCSSKPKRNPPLKLQLQRKKAQNHNFSKADANASSPNYSNADGVQAADSQSGYKVAGSFERFSTCALQQNLAVKNLTFIYYEKLINYQQNWI